MAERSYRLTVAGELAQIGQILAVFEMLTGQVFLVTLVAGLVSLWRPAVRARGDGGDDERRG